MGAGVDDKIDLFVERILARMVIDDAQRAQIEPEIRNHLDEAVREAEDRGLSREDAAHEAMLLFGQASVIARQFHPNAGARWFILERSVLVLLLAVIILGFPSRDPGLRDSISIGLDLILFSVTSILLFGEAFWNRVHVNGGLVVKRLFHRTQRFRFEDIQSVTFGKGHLFGARYIKIKHSVGDINVSTSLPGMRAAGLALTVLAPAAMKAEVKEYLRSVRMKIRIESRFFKISISCLWGCAIIALLLGVGPVLLGEGYPWATLVGGVLALTAILIQGKLHVDQSKKGLCWLIAILVWVTFLWSSAALVLGSLLWVRVTHSILIVTVLLPIPIVWWRGRRVILASLVGGTLVLSILGALFLGTVRSRFETQILARNLLGDAQVSHFTWLPNDEGAAWISTISAGGPQPEKIASPRIFDSVGPNVDRNVFGAPNPKKSVLTFAYTGRDPIEYALPGGAWGFFPPRHHDEVILAGGPQNAKSWGPSWRLFALDREGQWKEIAGLPANSVFYTFGLSAISPWSSDARYLILDLSVEGEESANVPTRFAYDIERNEAIRLGEPSDQLITRWMSDSEIEVISIRGRSRDEVIRNPDAQATITITVVDVESKEFELIRKITLEPGEHPVRFLEDDCLLTVFPSSDPGSYRSARITLFYLDTGDRRPLPPAVAYGSALDIDVNEEGSAFAYVAAPRSETGAPSIILAAPGRGVIEEKVFRPKDVIHTVRLSSLGESVFYVRTSKSPIYIVSGIPQPEIWNYGTGETSRTTFIGGLWGAFFFIMSGRAEASYLLPRWSPDGRKLAYNVIRMNMGPPRDQIESVKLD